MGTFVFMANTWVDIDQVYRVDTYTVGKDIHCGVYLPFHQGPLMVRDAAEVDHLMSRMKLYKTREQSKVGQSTPPKSDLPVK